MNFGRVVKALFMVSILIATANLATASEVKIDEVKVTYMPDRVNIEFKYQLDAIQKITGFLFGASYIKDEIIGIFEEPEKLRINKIGFDRAEFSLDARNLGDIAYFSGTSFSEPIPTVTLIFPGNSTVKMLDSSKIPEAYYSLD